MPIAHKRLRCTAVERGGARVNRYNFNSGATAGGKRHWRIDAL